MPPRKKAVPSTDVAKPVSSRSTRANTRQANAAPAPTAVLAKPVSQPAKPVSKPKSSKAKRVRDDDDEKEDDVPSKIAKLNKDDDTSDSKADNEVKKMASIGRPIIYTARCSPLNFQVTVVRRGAAPVDPMSGLVSKYFRYTLRAWT